MLVRLLGAVEVASVEGWVRAGPVKRSCVLAALAVVPGESVSLDALTDRVWSAEAPSSAHSTLYGHIAHLRTLLKSCAGQATIRKSGPDGYLLDVDPEQVDVHAVRTLARQARELARDRDVERAVAVWRDACGLMRGEPLAGLGGDWAAETRAGLRREHVAMLAERFAVELDMGRHHDVVEELSRQVAGHPLAEGLVACLMTALYRCGRPAEALDAFAEARARLADRLGLDPGDQLQTLHLRILNQDSTLALPSQAPPEPPGTVAEASVSAHLPLDVPDFVGRDAELAQLDDLLDKSGRGPTAVIVALAGAGGVGKTALAVRWAHRESVCRAFPDGCLYVNLRGFSEHAPITVHDALSRLLRQLGVDGEQIPHDLEQARIAYDNRLRGRRVLAILDNAADADQVRSLLTSEPSCLALVTSRDRLSGLAVREGAHRIFLDRLPTDDADGLAARLLEAGTVDRESGTVTRLTEVCARLPLAIRVAAAGYDAAHPDTRLSEYVDQLAEDRLGVLDSEADDSTAITAVLSWSTSRLSDETAAAFGLLGAHPGPHLDLAAAAAMLDVPASRARRLVRDLTAASLVEEVAPGRYSMHDLLRDYAREHAERLNLDLPPARARLLAHYTSRLADEPVDVDWFRVEQPGLTRCLQLPRETSTLGEFALRLGPRLWSFCHYPDARNAFDIARETFDAGADEHAIAVLGLGRVARVVGEWDKALTCLNEALEAFRGLHNLREQAATLQELMYVGGNAGSGDLSGVVDQIVELLNQPDGHDGRANLLITLAEVYLYRRNDFLVAREYGDLALTAARKAGDPRTVANALMIRAQTAKFSGDLETATVDYTAASTIFRDIGIRRGEANVLIGLGDVATKSSDYEAAIRSHRQAMAVFAEIGDLSSWARALYSVGQAALAVDDTRQAGDCFTRARQQCREIGDRTGQAYNGVGMADTLRDSGNLQAADTEYRHALKIFEELGDLQGEAKVRYGMGRLAAAGGDTTAARHDWEHSLRLFEAIGASEAEIPRRALGSLSEGTLDES